MVEAGLGISSATRRTTASGSGEVGAYSTRVGDRTARRTSLMSSRTNHSQYCRAVAGVAEQRSIIAISRRLYAVPCTGSYTSITAPLPHRSNAGRHRDAYSAASPTDHPCSSAPGARGPHAIGLNRTRFATRSGERAAARAVRPDVVSAPTSVAARIPTASMTARMSSACCSSVGTYRIRSESPKPRGCM